MKRLVICLDGTWNTPDEGDKPTNVVKIMRALRPRDDHDIPQIVFYDKGVGTGGPIDRVRGGAMGRGLDDNIHDGYRFIANNFEVGDEIYLFGFSRGAFTARSLAGFIGWMGLIKKGELGRLPKAWSTYRLQKKSARDKLLKYSRRGVPIKCIGVWDTVGALGIPSKLASRLTWRKYRFHNTSLGEHIDYAFQALAIDEKRGPFEPTLWQCLKGKNVASEKVQQVWFTGVHSNVGGSYADAVLSDIALDWMIKRVEKATDLAFSENYREQYIKKPEDHHQGTLYDSLDGYFLSRKFPFERMIGENAVEQSLVSTILRRSHHPEKGHKYVNEMIHRSAIDRFGKEMPVQKNNKTRSLQRYIPENLAKAKDKLPIVEYDGSISE